MSTPAGVVDGLLAGRYRLSSRLGAGGAGEVWRARDVLLDRDVAVKTLRADLADDDEVRARFRGEARHTGRLSHPGIASVYDFGESDGRAWLILELVEGESLRTVLRREGRLDADRVLDVVAQTAFALQAAHAAGVVHRDIKPGNLLLRADGRVKVTDFGIASAADAAPLTRTGQLVGTAAYLSPEQAAGRGAEPASDLYALGVVAYECLAGSLPFPFDTPVAVLLAHVQSPPPPLPAEVPAAVAGLVSRLLAKDPGDRPTSAQDAALQAEALRRSMRGPTGAAAGPAAAADTTVLPVADPPTPARPLVRPARRSGAVGLSGRPGQRRAVRATAVLLGLLALGLGLRESLTDSGSAPADPRPGATAPAATAPPSPQPTTGPAPVDQAPARGGTSAPAVAPPAAPVEDEPAQQAPAQDAPAQDVEAPPADAEPPAQDAEPPAPAKADQGGRDKGQQKSQDPPGAGKGSGPAEGNGKGKGKAKGG